MYYFVSFVECAIPCQPSWSVDLSVKHICVNTVWNVRAEYDYQKILALRTELKKEYGELVAQKGDCYTRRSTVLSACASD